MRAALRRFLLQYPANYSNSKKVMYMVKEFPIVEVAYPENARIIFPED